MATFRENGRAANVAFIIAKRSARKQATSVFAVPAGIGAHLVNADFFEGRLDPGACFVSDGAGPAAWRCAAFCSGDTAGDAHTCAAVTSGERLHMPSVSMRMRRSKIPRSVSGLSVAGRRLASTVALTSTNGFRPFQ